MVLCLVTTASAILYAHRMRTFPLSVDGTEWFLLLWISGYAIMAVAEVVVQRFFHDDWRVAWPHFVTWVSVFIAWVVTIRCLRLRQAASYRKFGHDE
jgi:hypothetical protein